MKTAAVIPIKLNSVRTPGKNIKPLSDGTPLIHLIQKTLLQVSEIDEIYVYCSNEKIKDYLMPGVKFFRRSEELDRDTTKMNEVLSSFARDVQADVYVLTHATAPFISEKSISEGLRAVLSGEYDSAFSAKKLQDFLWKDGAPFNYELSAIPRTQDLPELYEETSGFYIYRAEIISGLGRRIGNTPYIAEVGELESIDIDEPDDFIIADAVYSYLKRM